MECVVSQDGDFWTIDERHPAYPRRANAKQMTTNDDGVPWLTKVKNLATAAAQHIAAGMPTASDEVILERWTICQGCEFLKNDACSKCGCPVARDRKFVSKLAWADQSCPVGKWGPAVT